MKTKPAQAIRLASYALLVYAACHILFGQAKRYEIAAIVYGSTAFTWRPASVQAAYDSPEAKSARFMTRIYNTAGWSVGILGFTWSLHFLVTSNRQPTKKTMHNKPDMATPRKL